MLTSEVVVAVFIVEAVVAVLVVEGGAGELVGGPLAVTTTMETAVVDDGALPGNPLSDGALPSDSNGAARA